MNVKKQEVQRQQSEVRNPEIGPTLDRLVRKLLDLPDLASHLDADPGLARYVTQTSDLALGRAFGEGDRDSLAQVQRALYYLYEELFRRPSMGDTASNEFDPLVLAVRNRIERAWEDSMRERVTLRRESIPADEEQLRGFVVGRWADHRALSHPLFDYLESEAPRDALRQFFVQEGAVSTRFADILVLSLVGAGDDLSRHLVENLWEEMGHGDPKRRHTKLFERLLKSVDVNMPHSEHMSEYCIGKLGWRGVAGYNLYIYLALHRRNYFRNIGGIGVGEWIVPEQCRKIVNGCFRVGFSNKQALAFYIDHVEADTRHGRIWLDQIIVPLATRNPEAGFQILEGAEMCLNAAADYYDEVLEALTGARDTAWPDLPRVARRA